MNDLRRKRKMSDGIRSSKKIKKRTSINAIPINVAAKEIKKPKKNLIIKNSIFIFNRRNIIKNKKKLIKWFLFILVYVYILFFIFNKLEKTTIEIKPRTKIIKETRNINVYSNPKYGQLAFNIISIKDVIETKFVANTQVNANKKASGIITIFNDYSTEPQKLSPNTRFKSISGKIFRLTNESVVIPGKDNEKPGKIDVMVYADKAGESYNIDITDFTIPGFKESGLIEKYNKIYALSLKSFTGGFSGNKLVLGDEQRKKVISDLESELKEILIKRLNTEKTDRVIIVDGSIQILFKEAKILNSDTLRQEAQIFALLIEKKQLEKFLKKEYLPDVHKDDISLLDFDGIDFNYEGVELNFNKLKKININMRLDSIFKWNINKSFIKESLIGLNKDYIKTILKEFEEIDSAKIQIQPFWQKHVSGDLEHIILKVE